MKRALPMALWLCLCASAETAMAQDIGRLFFTPEQRAALDARRKARVPDKPSAAPIVASPTTRLDGFVRRSHGRSTVWINGEALGEVGPDAPHIDPRQSTDARVSVPVGDSGARAALKPGQVLDRSSGEVRDIIGNGAMHVRRMPK
jgi:hypothetical protein